MVRPALGLSVTQLVGNARSASFATFSDAPAGVAPLPLINTLDRTRINLTPSLDITGKQGLSVRVGGTYRFSGAARSFGGYVQMGKNF